LAKFKTKKLIVDEIVDPIEKSFKEKEFDQELNDLKNDYSKNLKKFETDLSQKK
jgi:hypothetical protein